ncbi:MAG: NAD-dependent deacetylase [Firmicutes bacterium ML8_F2]|jgi:NAD-dependent deacetylase|nr:MAG: NAD-dependent deacetylase [Firmicutes bacterium ML8_F2]
MNYRKQIDTLARLLRKSERCYVLTGAGISTDSGIPDFRSPGTGLWEKADPIAVSSLDVLQSNPRLFYEAGFSRFARIALAEPNPGHYALAELERLGFVKGLVTQNIDGLHVKAGSRKVWEVHGHLRSGYCMGCGKRYSFEELVNQVELKRIPPVCSSCDNVLRPDVVLFGDPMPPFFFDLQQKIYEECDFMLVVGSSLVVYPVADLPRLSGKLAIINRQPTEYDQQAEIVIRENISMVMTDLLRKIETM